MKRITFLDGLRGIAILLVILFHVFSRYPAIVPYGSQYKGFPLFTFGYLGVPLFFLISGFVILMSLEKNKTFKQFIYKRWLRLFPAMLIASVLIISTVHFLPERPAGIPKLNAVIPGLIFIEPVWIKFITGIQIDMIENSFWSLFVEFKFYFIFGALYFILGRTKAILGIFFMYLFYVTASILGVKFLISFSHLLSWQYFGWFTGGALAYLYFVNNKARYLLLSIGASLLQLYNYQKSPGETIGAIIVIAIFVIPVYFEKSRLVFSNKLFTFFGLVSYPLYLIHENAIIALIIKLGNSTSLIPNILLPVIPLMILIIVSYIIVKMGEPFLIKKIQAVKTSLAPKPAL